MSGPSSPDTTVQCRPAYRRWLASHDPHNPSATRAPSGHDARTRQWWRAITINAARCGVTLNYTAAVTDGLFADQYVTATSRPSPAEMVVGYEAHPEVPEWVSTVVVDPMRHPRFVLAAYVHLTSDDSAEYPVWMMEPVAEWFVRNHLAHHHGSVVDPIVAYYRRRREDVVDQLSAGNAEPTVGFEHTSSGDAEGSINDGGAP